MENNNPNKLIKNIYIKNQIKTFRGSTVDFKISHNNLDQFKLNQENVIFNNLKKLKEKNKDEGRNFFKIDNSQKTNNNVNDKMPIVFQRSPDTSKDEKVTTSSNFKFYQNSLIKNKNGAGMNEKSIKLSFKNSFNNENKEKPTEVKIQNVNIEDNFKMSSNFNMYKNITKLNKNSVKNSPKTALKSFNEIFNKTTKGNYLEEKINYSHEQNDDIPNILNTDSNERRKSGKKNITMNKIKIEEAKITKVNDTLEDANKDIEENNDKSNIKNNDKYDKDKKIENELKEIKNIKNSKLQSNNTNNFRNNHMSFATKTTKISNDSTIIHNKNSSSKADNNINLIFSEADCPEELHLLYVNLIQQNKSLALKFDKGTDLNIEDED